MKTTNDANPPNSDHSDAVLSNRWIDAIGAIKGTPIGESGNYLGTGFFRDDRRHITLIRDGIAEQYNNDHGAAELVRIHLK